MYVLQNEFKQGGSPYSEVQVEHVWTYLGVSLCREGSWGIVQRGSLHGVSCIMEPPSPMDRETDTTEILPSRHFFDIIITRSSGIGYIDVTESVLVSNDDVVIQCEPDNTWTKQVLKDSGCLRYRNPPRGGLLQRSKSVSVAINISWPEDEYFECS